MNKKGSLAKVGTETVNGVPGGGKYMVSNLTSPTTPPTQIDYSVYLKSREYD